MNSSTLLLSQTKNQLRQIPCPTSQTQRLKFNTQIPPNIDLRVKVLNLLAAKLTQTFSKIFANFLREELLKKMNQNRQTFLFWVLIKGFLRTPNFKVKRAVVALWLKSNK